MTRPSVDRIQHEIAVALSVVEQCGTGQPGKTYEDGIADGLMWVLGGAEPATTDAIQIANTPALLDAEYDNERLIRVASESPTVAEMVRNALAEMDEYGDRHFAIWLGSFVEDRPKTQVQLVITQHPQFTIDED